MLEAIAASGPAVANVNSNGDRHGAVATIAVSVVVPTYRRHDLLEKCLQALVAQDLDPAGYEVIIADDDASPQTEQLVAQWANRSRVAIRYVPVTATQGPAGARNAGWCAARGDIIAFTDDDCLPDPSWLRAGLAAFCDDRAVRCVQPPTDFGITHALLGADAPGPRLEGVSELAAVTGTLIMPLPDRPTDYQRDSAGLTTAEFVTANCFCRRAALEAVGGFDERFTLAWREDSDLQFSLLEQGYRIQRAASSVVTHPVRPAPWGVSIRQQRKSQFNSLLYRKHPKLYRQRIPPFPRRYYAINALLFMAVVCAISAAVAPFRVPQPETLWRIAAVAFAGWLSLATWFCARRLRGASKSPAHIAEMFLTSLVIPSLALYWLVRGNLRFRAGRW